MTATPSPPTTVPVEHGTLDVPGATLHYEVRGTGPLVALHAAPMDARAFEPLAELLAVDYSVLTSDPRGIARSTVEDRRAPADPDERADDLARLLRHVDRGPTVVVGSSGGAVSALALAAAQPELLAGVVAHEPPLAMLLEDQSALRVATERMIATYRAGDRRGYWTDFLATADIELPPEVFDMIFGADPSGQDAEDERFGVEQMHQSTTFWQPPIDVLRDGDVAVVIGIGTDSAGQLCDRSSRALAVALELEPTMFPGDHVGFADQPDAFAVALRDTLGTLGH